MSNFSDFWGATNKKLKANGLKLKAKEWGSLISTKSKPVFSATGGFFCRLLRLAKILNRTDKIALLILLMILLGLLGYKFNRDWLSKTKKIPAVGGTYQEILIGEARYLNPILAKSDTDKTINRLIYSGLCKIDKNGQLAPDLAKNWEITPDGRTYTFHLRSEIFWHDGQKFSSADVAATVEAIKDQNIKSPYFEAWKDVAVEAPNEETVVFKLKDSYGPFIFNTLVGIIPAHLDPAAISSSPVGTGPYRFSKVVSGKNSKIKEVILARSDSYFDPKPYIKEVDFQIVDDENQAKSNFGSWSVQTVAGVRIEKEGVNNYSFPTSRYFGLIFNLRDEKLKDETLRKKISVSAKASLDGKAGEKFDPALELKMLVLDKPLSVSEAQSIKEKFSQQGINVVIDKKNAIDYQNLLEKRNFVSVLYGFDSGYDRDPYTFWHSSQVASGSNVSGFSDKPADILLEDARMTVDTTIRNQKYDQFLAILDSKAAVIFFPNQTFVISVKSDVLGIETIKGSEPRDHLNSFVDWYIKTKRVKP